MDFWDIIQLLFDLLLLLMVLFLIRKVRTEIGAEAAAETSRQLMTMIEPLVKETQAVAKSFEEQLKEKKHIVHQLNEDLDSRIISLNLLLNRARGYLDGDPGKAGSGSHVYQQQDAIMKLYHQNHAPERIAKMLSMPKGEVELVIDLKTKFLSNQ